MSSTITIGENQYQIDQLPDLKDDSFEGRCISFCKAWLNGQQEFVIHTSGSTGQPKEIILQRAKMKQSALATAKAVNLNEGETSLICLDPKYVGGMMMLVRSLEIKMKMVLATPSANPLGLINPTIAIDFAALVPYQIQAILKSDNRLDLNKIKTVLMGGAPVSQLLETELQSFNTQFYETYGMTETISHIALRKVNGPGKSEFFTVLQGVEIETDNRSCLVANIPYLQIKVITNDVVERKGTTQFKWLGRWDSIINTGGIKVQPEFLEKQIATILADLSLYNRILVVGFPDPFLGQSVTLLVEGNMRAYEQEQLKLQMRERLRHYEVPKNIYMLDRFVETENQKVNRKKTVGLVVS